MASERGSIINTIIEDFKKKFTIFNGYMDVNKIARGNIFSTAITQFPSLTVDFVADTPVEGDYLGDETATRTLSLSLQGGANTPSNNYEVFDQLIDDCELFLRSDNCSYDIIVEDIIQVEAEHDTGISFFQIKFSIMYDRQY